MPVGVATSTHLSAWRARDKDIKSYLHFDRRLKKSQLEDIANNPDLVAKNSFYPLLRFSEDWTKFRKFGEKQKQKSRPLRYASRRDAAIYARYRSILNDFYEKELLKRGIEDVPIAYRKIPSASGRGNKCNIDFAKDAFDFINSLEWCIVTVVDIKSYFESLDHAIIRKNWESLIGCNLPADQEAVFRAITRYSYVEIESVFKRLGMYEKGVGSNRTARRKRKIDLIRASGDRQICSPAEFRKYVCGGDPNYPSLIQRNSKSFGIPQGTPISDIVANFYLLEFDSVVSDFCRRRSGIYYRYSDDIVCIIPRSMLSRELEVKDFLQSEIEKYGSELKIQDKKVSVCEFKRISGELKFRSIFSEKNKNGLEYLGFEYDGRVVKIKNATLSNAWRKLKRHSYGFAKRYVKRNRSRGDRWVMDNFPRSWMQKKLLKDVSYSQDTGYEEWTFVKYIRRASKLFNGYERIFSNQTKRYRYLISKVVEYSLKKAIIRHGNAAVISRGGRP